VSEIFEREGEFCKFTFESFERLEIEKSSELVHATDVPVVAGLWK